MREPKNIHIFATFWMMALTMGLLFSLTGCQPGKKRERVSRTVVPTNSGADSKSKPTKYFKNSSEVKESETEDHRNLKNGKDQATAPKPQRRFNEKIVSPSRFLNEKKQQKNNRSIGDTKIAVNLEYNEFSLTLQLKGSSSNPNQRPSRILMKGPIDEQGLAILGVAEGSDRQSELSSDRVRAYGVCVDWPCCLKSFVNVFYGKNLQYREQIASPYYTGEVSEEDYLEKKKVKCPGVHEEETVVNPESETKGNSSKEKVTSEEVTSEKVASEKVTPIAELEEDHVETEDVELVSMVPPSFFNKAEDPETEAPESADGRRELVFQKSVYDEPIREVEVVTSSEEVAPEKGTTPTTNLTDPEPPRENAEPKSTEGRAANKKEGPADKDSSTLPGNSKAHEDAGSAGGKIDFPLPARNPREKEAGPSQKAVSEKVRETIGETESEEDFFTKLFGKEKPTKKKAKVKTKKVVNYQRPRNDIRFSLELKKGGHSVGWPNNSTGRILRASQLPFSGEGFLYAHGRRCVANYGSGLLVRMIQSLGEAASRLLGKRLVVNKLSKPGGGRLAFCSSKGFHASHRNGLEMDINFLNSKQNNGVFRYNSENPVESKILVRGELLDFDFESNFELYRGMVTQQVIFYNQREPVVRSVIDKIFVNVEVKHAMCEWAKERAQREGRELTKVERDVLSKIYGYWEHKDHAHIRLHCSPHYRGCQQPRREGWYRKVLNAKSVGSRGEKGSRRRRMYNTRVQQKQAFQGKFCF